MHEALETEKNTTSMKKASTEAETTLPHGHGRTAEKKKKGTRRGRREEERREGGGGLLAREQKERREGKTFCEEEEEKASKISVFFGRQRRESETE